MSKLTWPDRSMVIGNGGQAYFLLGDENGRGEILESMAGAGLTVRQNAPATGEFRGWSDDGSTNSFNLTGPLYNAGRIIADGFGTERALNLSAMGSLSTTIANPPDQSNGWFAVRKGKLMLPPVTVASSAANWGHASTNTEMNLVNSARWTFKGAVSGKLSGELLASDRTDVPALGARKVISVHAFSGLTFTNGSVSLRYDHTAAESSGIPEESLQLYQWSGADWQELPAEVNGEKNLVSMSNLTTLGTFAVGWMPPRRGSLLLIR